jgi:hypothetical protein
MEVYHLNLKHNTFFVGDQNRVEKITQFFDSIEFPLKKRIQNKQDCSKARELV